MKRQQWSLYAIALAVLIVGLAALGVPASTLLLATLVLVCPVMMMIMMGSMRGGHGHGTSGDRPGSRTQGHDHHHDETAGRR